MFEDSLSEGAVFYGRMCALIGAAIAVAVMISFL
jgi:hypothetical protein